MSVYKVSCVVIEEDHPGAILNLSEAPEIGKSIKIGDQSFVIIEIFELMPPRGDFFFLHVTCKPE